MARHTHQIHAFLSITSMEAEVTSGLHLKTWKLWKLFELAREGIDIRGGQVPPQPKPGGVIHA